MASLYKLLAGKRSSPLTQGSTQTNSHRRVLPVCAEILDAYHTADCNVAKPNEPIKVTVNVETPPVLMIGAPGESSGAFFSGNIKVDAYSDVELKSAKVALIQVTKYAPPFTPQALQSCNACRHKTVEVMAWDLVGKATVLTGGNSYAYPISHILSGDLPPSTYFAKDSYIRYELVCLVRYGGDQVINLSMPLVVQRSILRSHDRNSLRIFPPTEITASAVIPNVVYPRSTFPIEIRMDHVVAKDRRWRMRKLNWRLEESTIVRLGHCDAHSDKFQAAQREMKRLQRNRKIHKASGGLGHNTLNFYFEEPSKVVKARQLAAAARTADENPERVDTMEGAGDGPAPPAMDVVQTNEMDRMGSNWTVTTQQSPTPMTPMTSPFGAPLGPRISTTGATADEIVLPAAELYVEELRALAVGELKSGWKSDFSGNGRIEMNVEVPLRELVSTGFNNASSGLSSITSHNCQSPLFDARVYAQNNNECNCSVDVDDPIQGVFVSHNLILEAVVGEELLSVGHGAHGAHGKAEVIKHPLLPQPSIAATVSADGTSAGPRMGLCASDFQDVSVGPQAVTGNKTNPMNMVQGVATGVARVLRMQFRVCLTERSGMGLSWDMEVPPTYEAVKSEEQPPDYQ